MQGEKLYGKKLFFKVKETRTCLEIDEKEPMSMEKERVKIQEKELRGSRARSQRR